MFSAELMKAVAQKVYRQYRVEIGPYDSISLYDGNRFVGYFSPKLDGTERELAQACKVIVAYFALDGERHIRKIPTRADGIFYTANIDEVEAVYERDILTACIHALLEPRSPS